MAPAAVPAQWPSEQGGRWQRHRRGKHGQPLPPESQRGGSRNRWRPSLGVAVATYRSRRLNHPPFETPLTRLAAGSTSAIVTGFRGWGARNPSASRLQIVPILRWGSISQWSHGQ